MVATGKEMVREKNSSRSGKSQGISLLVRENKMFERSQEKVNFSKFILLPLLLVFSNIKILLYILQT